MDRSSQHTCQVSWESMTSFFFIVMKLKRSDLVEVIPLLGDRPGTTPQSSDSRSSTFFRNNQVSLVGILVEFVRAFNRLLVVIGNNRSLNVYFNPHVLFDFSHSQVIRSPLHRSSSSGCLPWSLCFEVQ